MAKSKPGHRRTQISVSADEAKKYGLTAPGLPSKRDQYISPSEAGRILGIDGQKVKHWIYQRRLPAVKESNGYWKIKVSDLEQFMTVKNNHSSRRILIFDRGGKTLDHTIKQLTTAGHEIIIAQNLFDAMLKAADLVPAMFMVNVSIDGGWDLIRKIRGTRQIKRLPVIVLSDSALTGEKLDWALELATQGLVIRNDGNVSLVEEVKKILGRIM